MGSVRTEPRWRRWLLVPVLALLAANLVLLALFTGPRLAEERHGAERLASLRERVEAQRRRTTLLRDRAEVAQANAAALKRFYSDVVCADDAARFALIESLEKDVAEAGVVTDHRSWTADDMDGLPLQHVRGTLPSEGSYAQLTRLLGLLERAPDFLIVDDVRLTDRNRGAATLDVTVSTYCRAGGGAS